MDEDDPLTPSLEEQAPPTRRPRFRTGPLIPLLGMGLCAYFLAQSKHEIAYFFSSSDPVDLGRADAYDFSRAKDGAYAKISGDVRGEAARYQKGFDHGKVWPLMGAPLMIERRGSSELHGPVQVEGELRMDGQLPPQYEPVILSFLKADRLAPPGPRFHTDHVWVLIDGHRPRGLDLRTGWLMLLTVVFLVNAYLLFRRPAG